MSSLRLRVLVEQNAELALELARHGYVLETGTIAPEGEARELMNNEHVWKAYLGIWQKFLTFTFHSNVFSKRRSLRLRSQVSGNQHHLRASGVMTYSAPEADCIRRATSARRV